MSPPAGSARAALSDGWRALWRWPLPTTVALLGAVVATLAVRAAWLRAALVASVTPTAGALPWASFGRAVAVLLVGNAVGALLLDATRAVALSAYALPTPRRRTRLGEAVRLGLLRTPAMVSVRALELVVYAALALGELFVCARLVAGVGPSPARQALVATAALAPSLALGGVVFAASRVAQALIARGVHPAPALLHGYDVVLRRFASLARLGLVGTLATLPLTVGALVVPFAALRAPLVSLAGLWIYAALVVLLGRDPRLAHG